jgi:hypothetical protein
MERKSFFNCTRQGQQTLTARGANFLNYATLSFCIIVMHIMLGTCVPNLRGRFHNFMKQNPNGGYEGLGVL